MLFLLCSRVSLVAQAVKNLPAMQETQVLQSLGQEDPLEKGMLTHSSILDRGAWWVTLLGITKNGTWLSDWHAHIYTTYICIPQCIYIPKQYVRFAFCFWVFKKYDTGHNFHRFAFLNPWQKFVYFSYLLYTYWVSVAQFTHCR